MDNLYYDSFADFSYFVEQVVELRKIISDIRDKIRLKDFDFKKYGFIFNEDESTESFLIFNSVKNNHLTIEISKNKYINVYYNIDDFNLEIPLLK